MSESHPARTAWVQPVLLAVATATTIGIGFLYLVRPNAGELGSIRVVVTDDDGKTGNAIHVVVAEAPLVQKEIVSPGPTYTGIVHYPSPYLIPPNLKLTSAKRHYDVTAETETGFTWVAHLSPEDLRGDAPKDKDGKTPEKLPASAADLAALGASLVMGNLKPGLVFEDFTWEAKGLRMPPSALPPKPFVQDGEFRSVAGKEGVVNFKVPYRQAPNVELKAHAWNKTFITECTATGFKWKNSGGEDQWNNGSVPWVASGLR